MAVKDQYIVGGLQMPPIAGPPAIASPTIAPTSTTGSGKDQPLTAEDAIALFTQLLSNPQIMQQLMGMLGGAGQQGGMGSRGPGANGTIDTPYNNSLWGGTPHGGQIQWMGGMPPGYNDDVARKLATSANVGNLWTQGGGQLASGLVSGLLGGGKAGQAAGGLTNLLPMLLPFLMK